MSVIRVAGVTKDYLMGRNRVHALRGVTLTVERGEMIAVMGASGLRQVDADEHPRLPRHADRGRLPARRRAVDELSTQRARGSAQPEARLRVSGLQPAGAHQALENVELPLLYDRSGQKRDTRALAAAALQRVGLGDRLDHQPSELSGGQQQRVAIARALVTEPTLLLADEPTGNLDSHTSVEVMALFQELNDQGITILIVTHEPDIAAYAKRIVEVRDGRILRDEPVADRASQPRRTCARYRIADKEAA